MSAISRRAVVLVVCALTAIGACDSSESSGGGGAASKVDAVCDAVAACEGADGRAQCESLFSLVDVSSACDTAIKHASCADHAQNRPSYTDTCFPPCDATKSECAGQGSLTKCDELLGELRLTTLDCNAVCKKQGLAYSGECGTSFMGETSAEPVCWCVAGSGSTGGSIDELPEALVVPATALDNGELGCEAIWNCGEDCSYDIHPELLSDACVAAIEAATCEEHRLSVPSYYDVCFPPCSDEAMFCNADDNITACTSDVDGSPRWVTLSCARECALEGDDFSGSCVVDQSGQAKCVCAADGLSGG